MKRSQLIIRAFLRLSLIIAAIIALLGLGLLFVEGQFRWDVKPGQTVLVPFKIFGTKLTTAYIALGLQIVISTLLLVFGSRKAMRFLLIVASVLQLTFILVCIPMEIRSSWIELVYDVPYKWYGAGFYFLISGSVFLIIACVLLFFIPSDEKKALNPELLDENL